MMKQIHDLLAEHPFFRQFDERTLTLIAGCGQNVRFPAGQQIFREGDPADDFFVIREGKVALEIHIPGRAQVMIETMAAGEVLGFSWLFPPYRTVFDARAVEPVSAISLDGSCLRKKCESDHTLGYELMKCFATLAIERLQATRLRLIDLYSAPRSVQPR